MKRITQILASVFFVITVLTVYLAFDFAINNAVSNKRSSQKRSLHDFAHTHDGIKTTKRRAVLPQLERSNRTMKHQDDDEHSLSNNGHRGAKVRQHQPAPLRAKPGTFHKGKTGVKVNKPPKVAKNHRTRNATMTLSSQHKEKLRLEEKQRV